ncbi:universal stress protein [Flavobacterium sp. DGU11]|uniref:Universal stress protein n=1 Tax=Flavobacterium arundinis TaxID=3139143 RepID=A0ABU9HSJ3_9FLAO
MKKILFPTDFSAASLNAFVYALHLAKNINAEIITLHVYELPIGLAIDNYDFLLENYNIGEWGVFENFKSEVPKLRDIAERERMEHIPVTHMLERGIPVDEIVTTAASERADIIVMGTKGATGLKEVFLGTIAEKVIRHAKSFVIAVPEGYAYEPIQKVLFLTEYEKYETGLLKKAKGFADIFKAHIHVLEVKKHNDDAIGVHISKWKDSFKSDDITFSFINTDATEDLILEFIDYHKINIAAMSIHHKNLFERLFLFSLSKQMAFHSTIPVLGIPA